jgi:hypothetical protein
MVIGDLPAGAYTVWFDYENAVYNLEVEIMPGMVTYFRFVGRLGFDTRLPSIPSSNFIPPDANSTAIP